MERRTHNEPVAIDRRKRISSKDADQLLHDATERLDRTVKLKREDFLKMEVLGVANDIQQQVQFTTFRDICDFSGSRELTILLCRNPKHPAANTGIATCDEQLCPFMRGITNAT